jgi:hypothetical protein
MSFLRPMQWFHSHADPIWPDGTFKSMKVDNGFQLYFISADFKGPIADCRYRFHIPALDRCLAFLQFKV